MQDHSSRIAGLHLVTDSALCGARGVEAVVEAAVRGGASVVQLREKALPTRDFVARARALMSLLKPLGVPLLVNDRLDVALACGADGLHVGQDDLSPEDVRRWMPHAILGLSVQQLEQLELAERLPVDYYGSGPVYPTSTKADASSVIGLDGLRALVQRSSRPIIGIGGIDEHNAEAVVAAGARGVAVVSALCRADDPSAVARNLRAAIERGSR